MDKEIQKILEQVYNNIDETAESYEAFKINVEEFKSLYEAEKYEDSIKCLMANINIGTVIRFLLCPYKKKKKNLAK